MGHMSLPNPLDSLSRQVLLHTKLVPPPAGPSLVKRPRLTQRLNDGMIRRLTTISAPPGFGKTTLLSEWILQSQYPVAWVSLDAGDTDPVRFWSYLIAALQTLYANIGDQALALLQSSQPLP